MIPSDRDELGALSQALGKLGVKAEESKRERRPVTRRTALKGTAAVLACAMMWDAGRAWAGVGGGDWGCNDAVAAPGNYFGHDGGWAYSSDGTCWISLSANCTIGRMTELYLNVTVKAYFANGGVWSPTWFTDFPDTHVRTFVWNATGGYDEDSHTGFYDTTYDSNSYHGPYCEITHRVSRKSSDWRCHPGAQVWCDSADNANGIWTQQYGRQVIPHHVLVNDDFWIGKIVTLRALSSPDRYADVGAGGSEGASVVTWSLYDASNQNWGVGRSAQGRCCFVPIHLSHQTYLDLSGGDWNDGDRFQIYGGNGSLAQSHWLHRIGTRGKDLAGAHLIIPECSGCAMDNSSCGDSLGTAVAQWNCYGDWDNHNQWWILEEPQFREASPGKLKLAGLNDAGHPVVGQALSAPGLGGGLTLPKNYGSTSGIYYAYRWHRSAAPLGRTLVKGQATCWNLCVTPKPQYASEHSFIGSRGNGVALETFALSLVNQEFEGGISYQCRMFAGGSGGSWGAEKSDGQVAGSLEDSVYQVKIRLTGKMAEMCDVDYELCNSDRSWVGAARNGAETPAPSGYGVEYLKVWVTRKDAGADEIAQDWSENAGYTPTEADVGKCITCEVAAKPRNGIAVEYLGRINLTSEAVLPDKARIRFFRDGESDPVYSDEVDRGTAYSVPQAATAAATREGCAGLDGWYVDPAYASRFADGTALDGDVDLYARNAVEISYASNTEGLPQGASYSAQAGGALCPIDEACGCPGATRGWYGKTMSLPEVARTRIACTTDGGGRWLDLKAEGGWHAKADLSDEAGPRLSLTRNATMWKKWESSTYDGIREDAR